MPRLGVLGTLVWDTIHARDVGRREPVEEWGGIAYALAAFEAAAGENWSMFPIIKIGADLRSAADRFLATLTRIDSADGVRTVPEPNNRVELHYQDSARRCESALLRASLPRLSVWPSMRIPRTCGFAFSTRPT